VLLTGPLILQYIKLEANPIRDGITHPIEMEESGNGDEIEKRGKTL